MDVPSCVNLFALDWHLGLFSIFHFLNNAAVYILGVH